MNSLVLPRLIGDGMILQRDVKTHIWGYDEKGRNIKVEFLGKTYKTIVNDNGTFDIWLDPHPYGGPYTMTISDDSNECIKIRDILIGEVWVCSGQSNMELPMNRVRDRYPEEMTGLNNPNLRCFKVVERVEFNGPLADTETGEWLCPADDNISALSATAYFFSKSLNEMTGIPVGYIDLSLGGSKISCWMSREMLEGYNDMLALADKYADEEFVESVRKYNVDAPAKWHSDLDAIDRGLAEHWESEVIDEDGFEPVQLPNFFYNTSIGNTIGCIYFRKSFVVPKEMAGKPARIWLGTLVDSDKTYVNGEFVGETGYQYPPRKYLIREGLLHEGVNNVTVRLKVENMIGNVEEERAAGRFTPDKKYAVFNEHGDIDLSGEWKYRVGAECGVAPQMDFISWKATGLYNGMTAPCHKYTIGGVNWYQGESDCEEADEYVEQFKRFVAGYRKEWNNPSLPVHAVELPNFTVDNNPKSDAWNKMREVLRSTTEQVDGADCIVTIDLGEDNDLHPQGKRELGRRLALLAANKCCGQSVECYGPKPEKTFVVKKGDGVELTIDMSHSGTGLVAKPANDKGADGVITDFVVATDDGQLHAASVSLNKNQVILNVPNVNRTIVEVRYCYAHTNSGALIYNSDGLPMSPGIYTI